ncbi:MAG: TetR family transcriptional regulator [Actinobacteria bacterium HGW-Actinobacteria-8]|nr:MAG: TetR family transcriptional regulator [Actinobacteria bacterium HGW-Actinobacteria-8]
MVSTPDHTARANIRECALSLFADRGFDAVTVRDIAACAEVSPGLVLHHYGSKEGLREAVDAHVAGLFDEILAMEPDDWSEAINQEAPGFVEIMLAALPTGTRIPAYLRRLFLSGDPVGKELFKRWYTMTLDMTRKAIAVGVMQPVDDVEARAAFLLCNDLSMILFRLHLVDAADIDPLTDEGLHRYADTAMRAYTTGVFRTEKP